MIATVRALPPGRFDEWLAQRKTLIAQANAEAKVAREKLSKETGAGAVENP
jgi:heme/copper-type cytochrome/quinol oxidase subunit 2